jgi:hypothetical protein
MNSILAQNGLLGANEPVGFWKYADKELGITKCCGIFKTISDLRLGTNLFQGLHLIINKEIAKFTNC